MTFVCSFHCLTMDDTNAIMTTCGQCGKAENKQEKVQLKQCSRCLRIKYCSRECQKNHWKQHKVQCKSKAKSSLPPEASGTPNVMSPDGAARIFNQGFRVVTVAIDASKALCCCWCCGVLIKKQCQKTGPPNAGNTADSNSGPFWTELYGRKHQSDRPIKGRTVPALFVLGSSPGSRTGFACAVNSSGQGAACFHCAKALQQASGNKKSSVEKHIRKCEDWLADEELRAATAMLTELSVAEARLLAFLTLDQKPKLGNGPRSIAGYHTKKQQDKTRLDVPFCYKNLEEEAFPTMLCKASGFKGGAGGEADDSPQVLEELVHYTTMRLHSADARWRENWDYVVFSVHRLAAYGWPRAKMMLDHLPEPLPRERFGGQQQTEECQIVLQPDFV